MVPPRIQELSGTMGGEWGAVQSQRSELDVQKQEEGDNQRWVGLLRGSKRDTGDPCWGLAAVGSRKAQRRSALVGNSEGCGGCGRPPEDRHPSRASSALVGKRRSQPAALPAFPAASPASRSFQTRKEAANMAITFCSSADSCQGRAGRERNDQSVAGPRATSGGLPTRNARG